MIKVFEPKLSFSDKLAVFSSIMKNEISGSSPIVKKFEAFGFKVFDIDGHDHQIIFNSLKNASDSKKPCILLKNKYSTFVFSMLCCPR